MYLLNQDAERELVIVTTKGDLDADQFFGMIGHTRDLCERMNARRVLVDHSSATVGGISNASVRSIASFCTVLNSVLEGGRLAVVLVADLDFGLGRMWLSLSEEMLTYSSELFRTRREAEGWLMEAPFKPHSGPG